MQLSDFDYLLPEHLIAQHPTAERTASRLLQLGEHSLVHGTFVDLQHLLQPGDLLVLNDTRVVKARLQAIKDSGGVAEILLERVLPDAADITTTQGCEALCQVRVSKPLKPGRVLRAGGESVECLGRRGEFYHLRFPRPVFEFLEQYGELPLPPYINRENEAQADSFDEHRYQTVFARELGAIAAPTAGLHFSESFLASLQQKGIAIAHVTLHVGAGTFQPVRKEDLSAHVMHEEHYHIQPNVVAQIERTKTSGGRVIAVGTTVIRTLEAAAVSGTLLAGTDTTRLFITPGYEFRVVDALVTNFHLPKSTLMMLVSAFGGYEQVMAAYRAAVEEEYRFFSYGDAMFLERAHV